MDDVIKMNDGDKVCFVRPGRVLGPVLPDG